MGHQTQQLLCALFSTERRRPTSTPRPVRSTRSPRHLLPRQRRRVLRRLAPCPPPVGLLLQPPLSSLSLRLDGAGILPTCPAVFWGVQHDRLRLNDGIEGAFGFPFPASRSRSC